MLIMPDNSESKTGLNVCLISSSMISSDLISKTKLG
jgi:hypothetical protein